MKSIIKWKNYLSLYLLAISLINIALLYFPLFNVFGYEFSVINSMLLVIFSGIYTINFYDAFFKKENNHFTNDLFESALLILLIPFLISVINSIFTGFCSFTDGILFYLVITAPSIVIGISLGLLSTFISDRFRILWLFIFYFGILLIVFFEIYFNPQVYVYNPVIGYFPGTIYDEGISVSWKLVFYRSLNIIFFGYIIKTILRIKRRKNSVWKMVPILSAFILLIGFYLLSPSFGFSTTKAHLESKLAGTVESDHFIINFDKRIDRKQIKILALNQEYYYQKLRDFFATGLKEKTHTFIFYDDDQKKELFGSQNADVAKPWLNHIYISYRSWEQTLKHELAHCFSGAFGSDIFKLAAGLNPLLIEGIAEAADGVNDENSLHFLAALAYNSGYKTDIENLFTQYGFFNQASNLSYIYAGSFIGYLIQQKGIQKFKRYYLNGEFNDVYDIQLNSFLENYYSFLKDYNGELSTWKANYYFGRKSLFRKVCPRAISEDLQHAWEQIKGFNFEEAREIFANILSKADNYSALVGLAKSFEEQDSILSAISTLSHGITNYKATSYYFNLEFILADLYAKYGNLSRADSLYSELAKQQPNRTLNYLTNIRRELVRIKFIKEYLNGSDYDKYFILQSVNSKVNNYWSFPVLISLSKQLEIDYKFFIEKLNMNITVNNYESSYAVFKLSEYMLQNYDFENARKFAGLALRYDKDENFRQILIEQFNKANWFHQNGQTILNSFHFSNN